MENLQICWVDLAIVGVLILGMVRGRKRGMSEELLDVLKWVLIVIAGAYFYQPAGDFMADMTPFSLLSCYVSVYLLIMLAVITFFSFLKRAVGEKLLESDCFGDAEYYLGIVAGAIRYACVLLVVMSFINARYYSPDEIASKRKTQMDNFGMVFYTLYEFQGDVFHQSLVGRMTRDYLSSFLIHPTAPEEKSLGGHSVRARERNFDEILE
jgi:uncharacterized membrane protein required for colicin V production